MDSFSYSLCLCVSVSCWSVAVFVSPSVSLHASVCRCNCVLMCVRCVYERPLLLSASFPASSPQSVNPSVSLWQTPDYSAFLFLAEDVAHKKPHIHTGSLSEPWSSSSLACRHYTTQKTWLQHHSCKTTHKHTVHTYRPKTCLHVAPSGLLFNQTLYYDYYNN